MLDLSHVIRSAPAQPRATTYGYMVELSHITRLSIVLLYTKLRIYLPYLLDACLVVLASDRAKGSDFCHHVLELLSECYNMLYWYSMKESSGVNHG